MLARPPHMERLPLYDHWFKGADTDKGGDLPTVEGAEFGECADEGEGGNGAQGDISEEEELVLPEDVGVNEVVYLLARSSSS